MPPGSATDPPSGRVFTVIERRLRERYHISIREHVGDVVVAEATGKFDPAFWEPLDAAEFEHFRAPREGAEALAAYLEGGPIPLRVASYEEFWTSLEVDASEALQTHIQLLRRRYSVRIRDAVLLGA